MQRDEDQITKDKGRAWRKTVCMLSIGKGGSSILACRCIAGELIKVVDVLG
jgi:hypothetical protein